MESKHIYGSTYITQTRNKGKVLYSGTPDEILLEAISPFNPQFAVHMPCQILSLSHYCFSSGFSMSSQNVGMYDLIYLYKGSVKVNYPVNNFIVNAKEFLFLNTDSRYTIEQFGTETLDILIIRNYGFICQSYYTLFLSQNIQKFVTNDSKHIASLLERLYFYYSYPSNANNFLLVDTMNQIYTQLYLQYSGFSCDENKYRHPNWFLSAIEYMENHYQKKLTISQIADAVDMSESLLYKKFRQYTNASPIKYLTEIRLRHAKYLLLNTDMQIKSIAYQTGFNSVSYFIKQFSLSTGVSPQQFRSRYIET